MVPVDAVAEALVLAFQVKSVQIGVVTGGVPPSAGKPDRAVVAPGVVVAVDSAELGAPGWQALAEVWAEAVVEDPVSAERVCESELVDEEADFVSFEVVEGDQQLHRLLVGQQKDALKAQPDFIGGGTESFLKMKRIYQIHTLKMELNFKFRLNF